MNKNSSFKSYSAIEMIVAVTIVSSFALYAVPTAYENYDLGKARVARVKADFRAIQTGLESYFSDNQNFPPNQFHERLPNHLSTPIAYLSDSNIPDPYIARTNENRRYRYLQFGAESYIILSPGADGDNDFPLREDYLSGKSKNELKEILVTYYTYDASNGAISDGDLWFIGN